MIQEIVRSVGCELRAAVTNIIDQDHRDAPRRATGRRYTDFLGEWGAEVALNLTVVEKSGINPTALLTPPSPPSIFTLGGGFSASSEATRIEKMNTFYTVADLYHPGRPNCEPGDGRRYDSPLVESDLRLYSLIEGRLGVSVLGYSEPPVPGVKNVLSHTVSFKLQSSGNITPGWKLVRASVNPTGTFFSASRDSTQELVVTFGPIERAKGARSLVAIAEAAHQNSQLQSGIRNLLTIQP